MHAEGAAAAVASDDDNAARTQHQQLQQMQEQLEEAYDAGIVTAAAAAATTNKRRSSDDTGGGSSRLLGNDGGGAGPSAADGRGRLQASIDRPPSEPQLAPAAYVRTPRLLPPCSPYYPTQLAISSSSYLPPHESLLVAGVTVLPACGTNPACLSGDFSYGPARSQRQGGAASSRLALLLHAAATISSDELPPATTISRLPGAFLRRWLRSTRTQCRASATSPGAAPRS